MSVKVSVVAIQHPEHKNLYFHGKRKDNDKWTMPGGHSNPGETEKECAHRECHEETGVKPKNLKKLHEKKVKTSDGEDLHVSLFGGDLDTDGVTSKYDPDEEFDDFKFLDPTTHGNMHIHGKRNVLLDYLKNNDNKPKLVKSVTLKTSPHNQKIRDIADTYANSVGTRLNHNAPVLNVDKDHAANIAKAYEAMPHNPSHPDVKRSYDALINETVNQFHHLKSSGLKTSKVPTGGNQPYKNSKEMFDDVKNNNHLWYFPTESGFGSNENHQDHPLLRSVQVGNESMPANDVFRIVHDVFGHAKEGFSFGPQGEENAWSHHKQMYSPEAQKALTSETRGQNSWVNFGPDAEHNRQNPGQTKYADQKSGLLPKWAMETGSMKKNSFAKSENTKLVHFSNTPNLTVLDPNKMGSAGTKGQESKYGQPSVKRTYFYREGTETEPMVVNHAKAKYHAVLGPQHKLYDIANDHEGIYDKLKSASMNKQVNAGMVSSDEYLQAIKDNGYHGFFNSKSSLPNAVALFHPHPVTEDKSFGVNKKEDQGIFDYGHHFGEPNDEDESIHIGQEPEGQDPFKEPPLQPKHIGYFKGMLNKLPKMTPKNYFKAKLKKPLNKFDANPGPPAPPPPPPDEGNDDTQVAQAVPMA